MALEQRGDCLLFNDRGKSLYPKVIFGLAFMAVGAYFFLVAFLPIGGLLAILGLAVLASASSTSISIDRSNSQMTVSSLSILGKKGRIYLSADITRVVVSEPRYKGNFLVQFKLKDGDEIYFYGIVRNAAEAEQISSYLSVPFDNQCVSSIGQSLWSKFQGSK